MLEEKLLDALCDQVDFRNGREIPIDPDDILKHYSMEEKKARVCADFIIHYSKIDHPDTNFLFEYYPNTEINQSRVMNNTFISCAVGLLTSNPLGVLIAGVVGGAITYRDERRYNTMNFRDLYINTIVGAASGMVIDSYFSFPGYFASGMMAASFLYSFYRTKKKSDKSISNFTPEADSQKIVMMDIRMLSDMKRRRDIKRKNLYRMALEDIDAIKREAPYRAT